MLPNTNKGDRYENENRRVFSFAPTGPILEAPPLKVEKGGVAGVASANSATCLHSLPDEWRARADYLRSLGADERAAFVWDRVADELQAALNDHDSEPLTLAQAADATGYSVDHLRKLIRTNRLTNAGRRGAPRVRRGDLPTRQHLRPSARAVESTARKERIARSVVNSAKERNDG
jgi:hypothetical protein